MAFQPLTMVIRNAFNVLSNIRTFSTFRGQMSCLSSFPSRTLSKRQESTSAADVCSEDEVLFEEFSGGKGLIKLNRPRQLNTLNASMVSKIRKTLMKWKDNKYLIVIKGEGPKAFCAGGDVVAVTKDQSGIVGRTFFKEEYKLDALISSMSIPVVAIISGIVMGGGVGISHFGKFRVATEVSMFAMPETQIGFFPDVGISYHLSRMPNHLGHFLALTGYRLKGYDLVHAGVATHFCTSDKLKDLEDALLHDFGKSCSSSPAEILDEFHKEAVKNKPPSFSLAEHTSALDKWFSGKNMEDVMKRISSDKTKFAEETVAGLNKMSPLSLKVTFRQMSEAANLNILECFNVDYRIALRMLTDGDFTEGVRALLVDKDKKPKWKHSDLSKVKNEEVDKFFVQLADGEELNLPASLYDSAR